ncbi:MAG TPA: hypothetical protein HA362_03975 [Nanoarchaeota archaeon]|nr:hypothetical protein [Nanoarchaeota archaeon]
MDKLYTNSETGCCPRFDPKPWDKKKVVFKNKLFLKDKVRCIFHIPLNFGKVIVRDMEKITNAKALTKKPLMLSDDCSLWRSEIYIETTKNVPDAEMKRISGTFLTRVFEGDFRNMGKWMKEMQEYVRKKGVPIKKMYAFYTTCPACAKVYGKNYVVLLAEI